jgi:hypothetical protein
MAQLAVLQEEERVFLLTQVCWEAELELWFLELSHDFLFLVAWYLLAFYKY